MLLDYNLICVRKYQIEVGLTQSFMNRERNISELVVRLQMISTAKNVDPVPVLILRCPNPRCAAPVADAASGDAASGGR